MKVEIKKALLEGTSPEAITEAVHANHPHLDKRRFELNALKRDKLANDISEYRRYRDQYRNNIEQNGEVLPHTSPTDKLRNNRRANEFDNKARGISQTGGLFSKENFLGEVGINRPKEDRSTIGKVLNLPIYSSVSESINKQRSKPRIISSAKE